MQSYNDEAFEFVKNSIVPALVETDFAEAFKTSRMVGCSVNHWVLKVEHIIKVIHIWGSNLISVMSDEYNGGYPIIIKLTNLNTAKQKTLDAVKTIKKEFEQCSEPSVG